MAKNKIQRWKDEVGSFEFDRAMNAMSQSPVADGVKTLLELRLEANMIQSGRPFNTQVDLGFARLDGLITTPDGSGLIAVSADGSHWHKDEIGHDLGKSNQMIGYEIDGLKIVSSVRLLESDLTDDPFTIQMALEGIQQNEFI